MADDTSVQIFPPEYPRTELVIGLVGPVGTNLRSVEETIKERLELRYNYSVDLIRLSHLLKGLGWKDELKEADEYDRYDTYMKAGGDARAKRNAATFSPWRRQTRSGPDERMARTDHRPHTSCDR
ncbi:MAG: hypothetical protein IPK13_21440 [Deltaproteobacteria bacterium]|nr:hypothetical protein [Deltaproteobacteria bacterium]